jgi:hypothetical protein
MNGGVVVATIKGSGHARSRLLDAEALPLVVGHTASRVYFGTLPFH